MNIETQTNHTAQLKPYSIKQIITIWILAALPMGVLGWLVAPYLSQITSVNPAVMRVCMLTLGLIWQFILVLILMKKETGNLEFKSLKKRLWLQHPINPVTKKTDKKMYLFTIPLLGLSALNSLVISPKIDGFVNSLFPILTEPDSMNIDLFIESSKSTLFGAWWFLGLFTIMSLLNTFLGEELLFRGVLLPRMNKVFKKYDWLVLGILFALYHVAMPWTIISTIMTTTFILSLPTKLFKSSWFGIIVHSGQAVFFFVIFLALVLGLA